MALAAANWLLLARQPGVAFTIFVCFTFLLRVGEALMLTPRTLVRSSGCYIAILGKTKRGVEQRVVVTSPSAVAWLDTFLRVHCGGKGKDAIANASYGRVSYWLRKSMAALGFGAGWTSHGLRRGGASELLAGGWSLEDVMLQGRWASLRSCREYLRRGETALARVRADFDGATWSRARSLASLGSRAVLLGEKGVH